MIMGRPPATWCSAPRSISSPVYAVTWKTASSPLFATRRGSRAWRPFAWFYENCVPAAYKREAQQRGLSIHAFLKRKPQLKIGESGCCADWWNGNRSVLVDVDLTGTADRGDVGTSRKNLPGADRGHAYGKAHHRRAFSEERRAIHELWLAGGCREKNKLLMQIYAECAFCRSA